MINDTLKANSPYINVSYDECVMGSVGYYKCMARGSTQSLDKPNLSVIIQGLSTGACVESKYARYVPKIPRSESESGLVVF